MGSRDRWALVAAAGLAVFMAQLDATIVNVALPALGQRLHASAPLVQWVVLGYVLPLIALSLLAGRWLDLVSYRAALTVAALGFAAASAAAGAAPALGWLVAARVIQGGFAAVLLALAVTLAVSAVRPAMRGRAVGIMSGIAPLGALSGPWLGGELVQHAGWRAIFYVSVPVAVAVAALGRSQLPAGGTLRLPERAWLAEATLLGGAAAALVLALSLPADGGAGWLVLGLAAVPLAWAWSRTAVSRPVLRLLRTRGVGGPHLALASSYTALMLVQFLAPFYLARVAGAPPAEIGTALLAYPATTAAAGPVAGLVSDKAGTRPVAVAGAVITRPAVAGLGPGGPGLAAGGRGPRVRLVHDRGAVPGDVPGPGEPAGDHGGLDQPGPAVRHGAGARAGQRRLGRQRLRHVRHAGRPRPGGGAERCGHRRAGPHRHAAGIACPHGPAAGIDSRYWRAAGIGGPGRPRSRR